VPATSTALALREQATALRRQADALDALADSIGSTTDSRVYGLAEMATRRNISANTLRSWAKCGRLKCRSGARKQYLTTDADVDAALAADVSPRTALRVVHAEPYDALEAELARGGLIRGAA
jgi:hypothetical protein